MVGEGGVFTPPPQVFSRISKKTMAHSAAVFWHILSCIFSTHIKISAPGLSRLGHQVTSDHFTSGHLTSEKGYSARYSYTD